MKKLITAFLTLSFLLTAVGGAYADTTTTTTTDTIQPPTTITDTTIPVTDPVTTPPAIVVETKAYAGTVKAIDLDAKTITVLHANKKRTKVFTYNDPTKFVYKGKAITLDKVVVGAKLVVNYQILSDKSEKVTKVQVVQMPKVKHVKHSKNTKTTKKVTKVTKVKGKK